MTLAESLDAILTEPSRTRCTVGLALADCAPDDRAALEAAFANPRVQATRIAAVLRAHGHTVANDAAQRHRRGACSCPSPTI